MLHRLHDSDLTNTIPQSSIHSTPIESSGISPAQVPSQIEVGIPRSNFDPGPTCLQWGVSSPRKDQYVSETGLPFTSMEDRGTNEGSASMGTRHGIVFKGSEIPMTAENIHYMNGFVSPSVARREQHMTQSTARVPAGSYRYMSSSMSPSGPKPYQSLNGSGTSCAVMQIDETENSVDYASSRSHHRGGLKMIQAKQNIPKTSSRAVKLGTKRQVQTHAMSWLQPSLKSRQRLQMHHPESNDISETKTGNPFIQLAFGQSLREIDRRAGNGSKRVRTAAVMVLRVVGDNGFLQDRLQCPIVTAV